MSDLVEKIAVQVPALIVLGYIVMVFLRSQKERDALRAREHDAFIRFIDEQNSRFRLLGDSCHIVQEKAVIAISENTRVMGRVEKTLEQAVTKIQEVGFDRRGQKSALES